MGVGCTRQLWSCGRRFRAGARSGRIHAVQPRGPCRRDRAHLERSLSLEATVDPSAQDVAARAVRVRTGEVGLGQGLDLEMSPSRGMSQLAVARSRLEELVGQAPFVVTRGSRTREAADHEALRSAVLELCREGTTLSRFKGLGEMNPEQLWETTMDPKRRRLLQVDLDNLTDAEFVHHAHGRSRRAAAPVHRAARQGSKESGHLINYKEGMK